MKGIAKEAKMIDSCPSRRIKFPKNVNESFFMIINITYIGLIWFTNYLIFQVIIFNNIE